MSDPSPRPTEIGPQDATIGLREVTSADLTHGREPVYARGPGWLVWRHGSLYGARLDGPRWPALLTHAPVAAEHLAHTAAAAGAIDLLIDARAVRLDSSGALSQAVASTILDLVRRLGSSLRRIALVAPTDWSTPWWHGLPRMVDTPSVWLTFSSLTQAYSWLDGVTPMHTEVGRLIERGPSELLSALERALRQRPACELSEVARLMGLSRRTLQRSLAREGVGFQALRTGVRLERARALLLTPHAKISAVAREVGFASTGHFILWFRRHHGVTPGAWRLAPEHTACAERTEGGVSHE